MGQARGRLHLSMGSHDQSFFAPLTDAPVGFGWAVDRGIGSGSFAAPVLISTMRLPRCSNRAAVWGAQAYLPPSYCFSHSPDSCSTQATASAFLVNPSICVWRPCGGVTRTYQPFPLFNRTGSNLAFGLEAAIVELCYALHQNATTIFLRVIQTGHSRKLNRINTGQPVSKSVLCMTPRTGEQAWSQSIYWRTRDDIWTPPSGSWQRLRPGFQ